MDVNVSIINLPEVFKRLEGIPGGAYTALRFAIIYALKRARTVAARDTRERYNVSNSWLLKAIGQPKLQGLRGDLNVSGSKAYLGMFPTKQIFPFGTATVELKEAFPVNLLHAFLRNGIVYERRTKDTPKYPIMRMVGLSAPQMIGQKTEVYPAIEFQMEVALYTELERLIGVILSGDIIPR